VRILVATDAAREGLNLQAHCYHLFHFDVPWNPSRMEQRNGRIDRKLQPAPIVYCHYFVYTQRPEDRVLQALVRETKTIREELGSLSQLLEDRLAGSLRYGIRRADAEKLAGEIDAAQLDSEKQQVTDDELEINRDRQEALQRQIDTLRNRLNDARQWIGLDNDQLRDAISCSLEMLGAEALETTPTPQQSPQRFGFPNLDTRRGADPTWKIAKVLTRHGLSMKDIKLIVVTHAHVDHAGSAARLRKLSGAPILAHRDDADFYSRKVPMTFCPTGLVGRLFLKTPMPHEPYEGFEPDILLKDSDTMNLAGFGVDGLVRHTAGHTPGSIAVELSSQDALDGDLIASGILLGGIAFTGRACVLRSKMTRRPLPANWNALYSEAPNASTWVMAVP
jgi:hypothetical protein